MERLQRKTGNISRRLRPNPSIEPRRPLHDGGRCGGTSRRCRQV
uniref:Uncharacterized protein n=1 Tax=Arundo donax TaxID=35708 RepID=A0A0A9HLS2_ARUDO